MSDKLRQELEQFQSRVYRDDSILSRVRDWVFFNGDRALLAGLIGLATFLSLSVVHVVGLISFDYSAGMTRLSTGIVAGEFSLLTIALSINQLIISQETGPAGQIQQRLDGMMDFRQRFERATEVDTTPSEPVEMLSVLADSTLDEIARLNTAKSEITEPELRDLIEEYCDTTDQNIENLKRDLSGSGPFNALSGAITDNYGWHAHLARMILAEYGDSLSDEASDSLESITELMKVFSIARAHFKTLYTRRELGKASRLILAVGIPGLLSGVVLNTIYGSNGVTTVPDPLLPLTAILLITIASLPIAFLASYILRTATVARRTANIGPMVLDKESLTET
ncbi:hypothetical protein KTS45_16905 [Halomicroarcula limicola]|uniref:Uncharacterized protein n=1 Tax=Haloarcula limicola TaxID=1429915 RepID=A0A8J7YG58_9EURY|nr:hypothetical protein [Halomicroarcula limicola]MBV0925883.1 hypothetical protein [Halomicroarcula limicola]